MQIDPSLKTNDVSQEYARVVYELLQKQRLSYSCLNDSDLRYKVSVVVPVYRGKFLFSILLNALQCQTLREIEIICVDDKGMDGSFDVAREAAKSDPRIVCVENEENRGPGYSRNQGIARARGEFIAFADADDLVPLDFYELLYARAKENDLYVVKGQIRRLRKDGSWTDSSLCMQIRSSIAKHKTMLSIFRYEHTSAIYKLDFIKKVGARYAENNARFGEDSHYMMMAMLHMPTSRFAIEDRAVYIYRHNEVSLIHAKKDKSYLLQMIEVLRDKVDFLLSQKDSSDIADYLSIFFENQLGWILDDLQKSGVSDEMIISYLDALGEKLKEWRDSKRLYKPSPNSCVFEFVNFHSNHFYVIRKMFRRLQSMNHSIDLLRCDLNNLCADVSKLQPSSQDEMRVQIDRLHRIYQLREIMPRLKRKYNVLRLKKLFSWGKRRKRYIESMRDIKERKRELATLLKKMDCSDV